MDLIANGDGAQMARPHIGPDRLDIVALAEADPSDAATLIDARRPRHDGANDAIERAEIMNLEQRPSGIEPFEPHAARVHAELFVEGLAE